MTQPETIQSSIHRLEYLTSVGYTGKPGFKVFWTEDDYGASFKFTLRIHQNRFLSDGFIEVFVSYMGDMQNETASFVGKELSDLPSMAMEWLTENLQTFNCSNRESLAICLQLIIEEFV